MNKTALLLLSLLFVAACSTTSKTSADIDGIPPATYIGLTVEQAKEKAGKDGVPFRIVMENGTALPVTMDYVVGRINAIVTGGIVTTYEVEGSEKDQPAAALYDQNSWKTLIPSTCVSFFDGCNNCQRIEGNAEAACTEMFCETYQKPECRDGQGTSE